MSSADTLKLAALSRSAPASVTAIDWHLLSPSEGRRLREFGLDEGVEVEMLQPSGLFHGPMSVRIGRMTIVMRHHVADAIRVTPIGTEAAA